MDKTDEMDKMDEMDRMDKTDRMDKMDRMDKTVRMDKTDESRNRQIVFDGFTETSLTESLNRLCQNRLQQYC